MLAFRLDFSICEASRLGACQVNQKWSGLLPEIDWGCGQNVIGCFCVIPFCKDVTTDRTLGKLFFILLKLSPWRLLKCLIQWSPNLLPIGITWASLKTTDAWLPSPDIVIYQVWAAPQAWGVVLLIFLYIHGL